MYFFLFVIIDKRVEKWLLMATPIPVCLFFLAYIAIVLLGPRLMKGRNALNIKFLLFPYNLALVVLSVYMFKEVSWLCYILSA